jgi:acyl phosphate:glycerol-3-phosphate acyltransferase
MLLNINKSLILFLIYATGYMIGAFSSGAFIAWMRGIPDITRHGSGSSGATNVGRMLGPLYFLLVLFCDALKAFFFLFVLHRYGAQAVACSLGAIALMLGNTVSFFFNAPRGKGVATALGIMLFFSPLVALACCALWIFVYCSTGVVGISSAVGLMALPCLTYVLFPGNDSLIGLTVFISGLGLWRHSSNLKHYFLLS